MAAMDLPGDPMGKNLPSSAGDVESISVQRTKIHMPEGRMGGQTTKPKHCNYRAHTSQLEKAECYNEDIAQSKKTKTSVLY